MDCIWCRSSIVCFPICLLSSGKNARYYHLFFLSHPPVIFPLSTLRHSDAKFEISTCMQESRHLQPFCIQQLTENLPPPAFCASGGNKKGHAANPCPFLSRMNLLFFLFLPAVHLNHITASIREHLQCSGVIFLFGENIVCIVR